MVVLKVFTTKNSHIIYFKEALKNTNYIRLISCSLYNSWHNLKNDGTISEHESEDVADVLGKIYPGNYTIESLGKAINNLFKGKRNLHASVDFNLAHGAMGIYNPKNKNIEFDRDLTYLLGFKERKKTSQVKNGLSSID